MKIMNISTIEAIGLIMKALAYNVEIYEGLPAKLELKKEKWISENQEHAWFGSSRERWEKAWYSGDYFTVEDSTKMDLGFSYYEVKISKLNRLLNRIKHIENEHLDKVVLEDDELQLLYVGDA